MLKTICSRKKFQLLPLLALFYFVIGAYALHPHFHNHNNSGPDDSHQHLVSNVHHHPSINGLDDSDHHSCPICNYFAVNTAVEINTVGFYLPSFPYQQEVSDCRMAVMLAHQAGFQIRGSPAITPA